MYYIIHKSSFHLFEEETQQKLKTYFIQQLGVFFKGTVVQKMEVRWTTWPKTNQEFFFVLLKSIKEQNWFCVFWLDTEGTSIWLSWQIQINNSNLFRTWTSVQGGYFWRKTYGSKIFMCTFNCKILVVDKGKGGQPACPEEWKKCKEEEHE